MYMLFIDSYLYFSVELTVKSKIWERNYLIVEIYKRVENVRKGRRGFGRMILFFL